MCNFISELDISNLIQIDYMEMKAKGSRIDPSLFSVSFLFSSVLLKPHALVIFYLNI